MSSLPPSLPSSLTSSKDRNERGNPPAGGNANRRKTPTRTLPSLLRYMEGYEIIVELKTGRRIRGCLSSSDDCMNLTLDDVHTDGDDKNSRSSRSPPKQRNQQTTAVGDRKDGPTEIPPSQSEMAGDDLTSSSILSSLDIRGPNIRYIHFPDNADLTALVRSGAERERNAANRYKRTKRK